MKNSPFEFVKNDLDNSVFVEGGIKGAMVFRKELYVATDDGLKKVLTDLNGKLKLKKVNPNNIAIDINYK